MYVGQVINLNTGSQNEMIRSAMWMKPEKLGGSLVMANSDWGRTLGAILLYFGGPTKSIQVVLAQYKRPRLPLMRGC